MRRVHPALPILVIVCLAILAVGALAFERGGVSFRYFPQTQRFVSEPFLTYFDQHGGESVLGPPLTDPYTSDGGLLTQTFQRAQLQLSVRGVGLAPIGMTLHLGDQGGAHTVDPTFAAFTAPYGGEVFSGEALSAPLSQNGLLVQDFENMRLLSDSSGVRLADLGEAVLAVQPPPSDTGRASVRLHGTPGPPPDIRASASVSQPTVGLNGEQTLYVYVEDELGRPVSGAQTLGVLRYGTGTAEVELPLTNDSGFASATFIAPPAPPGSKVVVQMHVLSGEIYVTVETTYFQWW